MMLFVVMAEEEAVNIILQIYNSPLQRLHYSQYIFSQLNSIQISEVTNSSSQADLNRN